MNYLKLKSINLLLAIIAGLILSATSGRAQGTSATIYGAPDGANWDYTITLTDTGTTQIGNFWYAWTPNVPPFFYLPSGTISNISGQSGWTGSTSANSIQFVDNGSANALNPGSSVELFYTASFSPTTLAAALNSGLSVAYSGSAGIESGLSTGDFTVMPVAAPEPSSLALLVIGSLGLLGARRCKFRTRHHD